MADTIRTPPGAALLLLHLLLPPAAFALSYTRPDDWAARNVFRVVLFSEAGALCAWAGLSDRNWLRRAVGTLAGFAGCWMLLWLREAKQTPLMLVENLLFPGAVTIALATAIKSSPAYLVDKAGQPAGSAWQFTVGQLLIFTSAVAVMIVLLQKFWQGSLMINPRLVIAEGAQLSVMVAIWSALPRRWRRLRMGAGAVVACAVGLVVQSFMSADWFWAIWRKLPNVSVGELWEDLLSIPSVMLFESLLAAATMRAARIATRPQHPTPIA